MITLNKNNMFIFSDARKAYLVSYHTVIAVYNRLTQKGKRLDPKECPGSKKGHYSHTTNKHYNTFKSLINKSDADFKLVKEISL